MTNLFSLNCILLVKIKNNKRRKAMKNLITCLTILSLIVISNNDSKLYSQTEEEIKPVQLSERNLGGPRLGVTYVPGKGELSQALADRGIGRVLSQFGWHFEYLVLPKGGGPSFAVQFVPLVAGVEHGTFIPSATLALGIRMPSGIEFGMGPNILFGGENIFNTALVIAFGKSFDYGGVSIPIDFVVATNPKGNRFSIIVGYSLVK